MTNGVVRPLVPATVGEPGMPVNCGDEDVVARVLPHLSGVDTSSPGSEAADRFRQGIVEFSTPPGDAGGLRRRALRRADGTLVVDLVRDVGRDRNGALRPTPLIFSVDSADPYDVGPVAGLIANPGRPPRSAIGSGGCATTLCPSTT